MRNFDKYIYHKTITERTDGIFFCWYLIGKDSREGVHFHGFISSGNYSSFANEFGFFASGIESHKRKPNYTDHKPIPNCIVTGGDCYCDGSSLQASEQLGWINPHKDEEYIWATLHRYYGYWIEPQPEEDEQPT